MAVYVDDANIPASVASGMRVHTSTWCHLMADTYAELEQFARRLKLNPAWVQVKPSGVHYDLTAGKRAQALRLGAVHLPCRADDGRLTPEWERVFHAARAQYVELTRKERA